MYNFYRMDDGTCTSVGSYNTEQLIKEGFVAIQNSLLGGVKYGVARPLQSGGWPETVDMYQGDSSYQRTRAIDDMKFWHSQGEKAIVVEMQWKESVIMTNGLVIPAKEV